MKTLRFEFRDTWIDCFHDDYELFEIVDYYGDSTISLIGMSSILEYVYEWYVAESLLRMELTYDEGLLLRTQVTNMMEKIKWPMIDG